MTAVRTPLQPVALRQLPAALRGLWKVCAATAPEQSIMRSLTINLVAATTADRETEELALIDALIQRLPCRAFLIVLDDDADELSASVGGAMRPLRNAQEIVLEQIELRGPRAALLQVVGIVRPLLVNDLSTHLYWAADWPQPTQPFDQLATLCDHAVVDSAGFAKPQQAVADLRRRGEFLTDLTWLRTRPWRRALAESFERFEWDAQVPTVATILHGGQSTGLAAASALGHWLEQKLAASVFLESSDAADHVGLESLALHHGNVELQITCGGRGDLVVHLTTAESCYLPFTLPPSRGRPADLLAAAIDLH